MQLMQQRSVTDNCSGAVLSLDRISGTSLNSARTRIYPGTTRCQWPGLPFADFEYAGTDSQYLQLTGQIPLSRASAIPWASVSRAFPMAGTCCNQIGVPLSPGCKAAETRSDDRFRLEDWPLDVPSRTGLTVLPRSVFIEPCSRPPARADFAWSLCTRDEVVATDSS